ncbi:helix-turn-helix transcriptional regulator [Kitasatospora purpeofusca]|uniref:helix-turn-helix transcriptional regulator n=1 Tax=Kitasatospora purpeofusca TaxID=67352 RepID=UPI0036D2228F
MSVRMVCAAGVGGLPARIRRLELGPVALSGTSYPPSPPSPVPDAPPPPSPAPRARYEAAAARQSGEQSYHLTLLTADGRSGASGAGDLLVDSPHAFDLWCFGVGRPAREELRIADLGVDLPASLLPVPPHRLRGLLGRRLSGREGTGALLAEFLRALDREAAALGPAEASSLGTVVVDLVAVWIARELATGTALSQEARQLAVVEGIREFIRHNLHDPDLTPPVIAAAHHISVSHLHRLFTRYSHGETVAAFIRGRRLRKAHRDLADPALRALPIHSVAARCGLPRASEFGRAFKAAYGLTPREHRHRSLSG